MLLAINLHEYLIGVTGVSITLIFPLKTSGIFWAKLDAPEPN